MGVNMIVVFVSLVVTNFDLTEIDSTDISHIVFGLITGVLFAFLFVNTLGSLNKSNMGEQLEQRDFEQYKSMFDSL